MYALAVLALADSWGARYRVAALVLSRCRIHVESNIPALACSTADGYIGISQTAHDAAFALNRKGDMRGVAALAMLLLHEVGHIMFRHLPRAQRAGMDMETANDAGDCAIHAVCPDIVAFQKEHGGLVLTHALYCLEDVGYPHPATTPSMEEVYAWMISQRPPPSAGGSASEDDAGDCDSDGAEGDGSCGCGDGDSDGDADGEGEGTGSGGSGNASGKPTSCGTLTSGWRPSEEDGVPPFAADVILQDTLKQAVEEAVRRGADVKTRGLTAAVSREVQAMAEEASRVDWRRKLAKLTSQVTSGGREEPSYHRPHRTQDALGWIDSPIRPVIRREGVTLLVIVDTSGSMDRELPVLCPEVTHIVRSCGAECYMRFIDVAVTAEGFARTVQDVKDLLAKHAGAGGGTDLRPAFTPLPRHCAGVLVITDGYTPWPTRPAVPTMVLTLEQNRKHVSWPSWVRDVIGIAE